MKRFASTILIFLFVISLSAQTSRETPRVSTSVFHTTSPPVREMKVIIPGTTEDRTNAKEIENPSLEHKAWQEEMKDQRFGSAPLRHVQTRQGSRSSSVPFVNIEGMANPQNSYPADPNGDVGLNYYIQTVNSSFSVYDKQGHLVYGPVHNSSLWDGFPGPWTQNFYFGSDPVIKYDHLAERWVMTTFSIDEDNDMYFTLVAVSSSSDPLGSYNLYAFQFQNLNDYPKLAIWHDAYYVTYRMFRDGEKLGPKITALDRDAMLAGAPEARMVAFDYQETLTHEMPYCSDIEGYTLSEDLPNYVLSPVANREEEPPFAALHLYAFDVNWQDPGSSTFEFLREIEVDEGSVPFGEGVEHPGNLPLIESLSFRLMYPLSYRDFGTHESIVACRTLRFPGSHYHKRWYELRRDSAEWYIHQTGSYLEDGMERWMGSINMNGKGDIALGYSASNNNSYPSVRYTGRLAEDPLNKMTLREVTAFPGEAPVNNGTVRNRWGDYSSMSVDPVGDSTFWFTAMYPTAPATSRGNWSTRIIAFTLDDRPSVYAGPDQLICDVAEIRTTASAHKYSRVYWTSDGDGTFSNSHSVNTTYSLGPDDMDIGDITLILHAVGMDDEEVVADTLVIHKRINPLADAGEDTTICSESVIMLDGVQMYADSIRWETLSAFGGSFSDEHDLNAIYIPSTFDKFKGYANLVLKVFNSSACEPVTVDQMRLVLEQCTDVINPVSDPWDVRVRPNPVQDEFTLIVQAPASELFTVELFKQNGKRLFHGLYQTLPHGFKQEFDLGMQPAGTYYLRLFNEQVDRTRQIIKQ